MHENEEIAIGQVISSPTSQYQVQKHLGRGTYASVIQCRNMSTGQAVALKVMNKETDAEQVMDEEETLRTMRDHDSGCFNIVRFYDSFTHEGRYCLEFEQLDITLLKFLQVCPGLHLQLKQLRPILLQLVTSLDFLKTAGIVHGDLKPENIMLVDHIMQPLKVRVIDFGLACNNPHDQTGQVCQTLWYRSPEILKKTPFNEAIDTWSLGCIAAELFMGRPLFPACDEHHLICQIQNTLGKLMEAEDDVSNDFWPEKWMERRFVAKRHGTVFGADDYAEHCDLTCFIDLLKEMLRLDSYERITPKGILQHPFITMSHLRGTFENTLYVKSSMDLLSSVQDQSSGNRGGGSQTILETALVKDSSNPTAKPPWPKRKRKPTPAFHGKRSKRRSLQNERTHGVVVISGSEDASSNSNHDRDLRRKRTILRREETDEVIIISDSEDAPSGSTNHHLKKRKGDKEEVSLLDEPHPRKTRRKTCTQVEPSCSETANSLTNG